MFVAGLAAVVAGAVARGRAGSLQAWAGAGTGFTRADGATPALPGPVSMTTCTLPAAGTAPLLLPGHLVLLTIAVVQRDGEADTLLGGCCPFAEAVAPVDARHGATVAFSAGLPIAASGLTELEPPGPTLALVNLHRGLVQADTFPIVLVFARAGEIVLTGRVRRKQDAAGVPPLPAVSRGALTVLHVAAPPAPVPRLGDSTPSPRPNDGATPFPAGG